MAEYSYFRERIKANKTYQYKKGYAKGKEQGRQDLIEKTINWIDKSTQELHKNGEPCCSISYGDKSELCDLHQLKEWLEKQKGDLR